jgi:hypothetical protein
VASTHQVGDHGKHETEKRGAEKYQGSVNRRTKEKDDRTPSEISADCSREARREDGKAEA